MRNLYESIMQSRFGDHKIEESILDSDEKLSQHVKDSAIKNLIHNPKGNEDELNKLWKKLDLAFDAGVGEGYWHQLPNEPVTYFVPIKTTSKEGKGVYRLALIGKKELGDDIIIMLNSSPVISLLEIKKWTEKVARTLHMSLSRDKYAIKLNFA